MLLDLVEISRDSGKITFGVKITSVDDIPPTIVAGADDVITGIQATVSIDPVKFQYETDFWGGFVPTYATSTAAISGAPEVNPADISQGSFRIVAANNGQFYGGLTKQQQISEPIIKFIVSPKAGFEGSDLEVTISDAMVNQNIPDETLSAPTALVTIPINEAVEDGTIVLDTTQLELDGATNLTYLWHVDGSQSTETTNTLLLTDDALVGKSIFAEIFYDHSDGVPVSTTTNSVTVQNVNDAPIGSVEVQGEVKQGEIISVDLVNVTDDDNIFDSNDLTGFVDPASISSYQWYANGEAISGDDGQAATLLLTQDHVGKTITVDVNYTDIKATPETVSSDSTSPVSNINDNPTNQVTVEGAQAATQAETLIADISSINDPDGAADENSVTYQWYADNELLTGKNANELVLTQDHVGKSISVEVSYSDAAGFSNTSTSSGSIDVVDANDVPTANVTITGAASQGETLTADVTSINDPDGTVDEAGATYQWYADTDALNGETNKELSLTQDHVGKSISVEVNYSDAAGFTNTSISTDTALVEDVGDVAIADVTVTGIAEQGEILTADVTTISDPDGAVVPGTATYQWYAGTDELAAETGQTLTLAQEHVGKVISVEVDYGTGDAFTNTSTSALTAPVADVDDDATADVTVTGTAEQGEILTADVTTISDLDGAVDSGTATYQWYAGTDELAAETGQTLTLTQEHVGKAISVEVDYDTGDTFINTSTSVGSPAVVNVNDPASVPGDLIVSGVDAGGLYMEANLVAIADLDNSGPQSEANVQQYNWTVGDQATPSSTDKKFYIPDDAQGKKISLQVDFTDELGGSESVNSDLDVVSLEIKPILLASDLENVTFDVNIPTAYQISSYDAWEIVVKGQNLPEDGIKLTATESDGKWSASIDLRSYDLTDANGLTSYAVGSLSGVEKFWSSTHDSDAYPSISTVTKTANEAGGQDVTIIWSPTGTSDPREYGVDVFDDIADGALDDGEVLASVTVKASGESSSTLDAILGDRLQADEAPDYTHTLVSNPDGSVDLGLKDDEGDFTIRLTKTADGISIDDVSEQGETFTYEGFSVVRIWDNDGPQDLRIAPAEIDTNSSNSDFQILGTIFEDAPVQLEFNGTSQGLEWSLVDAGDDGGGGGSGVKSFVLTDNADKEVATLQKTLADGVIELRVDASVRSDGGTTDATFLIEDHETLTILPEARAKATNFDLALFEIPPLTDIVNIESGEGRTIDVYHYEVVVEFNQGILADTDPATQPKLNITIGGESYQSVQTKIVDGGTEARFVFDVSGRVDDGSGTGAMVQGTQPHGEVRLVGITGAVKAASDAEGTTELVTNLEDKGNFSHEFIINSIYEDDDLSAPITDAPANSLYATDVASALAGDLSNIQISAQNDGDYDQLYLAVDGVPGSSLLFDASSGAISLYKPDQSEEVIATLDVDADGGFTLEGVDGSLVNIPSGIDSLTLIAGEPGESFHHMMEYDDLLYSSLELPLSNNVDVIAEANSGDRAANVTIEGTLGDDTIYVGMPDDSIDPTAVDFAGDVDGGGSKQISGSFGDDTIYGHKGVDAVYGGGGDDVIRTYASNDVVILSTGHDVADGGTGYDGLSISLLEEYMDRIGVDGLRTYSADITGDGDSEYVVEARVDGEYVQLASAKRVTEVELYQATIGGTAGEYAFVDMGEEFDSSGSTHFAVSVTPDADGNRTASSDVLPTPLTQADVENYTSGESVGTFELTAPLMIVGAHDAHSGALEDITAAFNFEALESPLPGGELLNFEVQQTDDTHVEGTVFDDEITLEAGVSSQIVESIDSFTAATDGQIVWDANDGGNLLRYNGDSSSWDSYEQTNDLTDDGYPYPILDLSHGRDRVVLDIPAGYVFLSALHADDKPENVNQLVYVAEKAADNEDPVDDTWKPDAGIYDGTDISVIIQASEWAPWNDEVGPNSIDVVVVQGDEGVELIYTIHDAEELVLGSGADALVINIAEAVGKLKAAMIEDNFQASTDGGLESIQVADEDEATGGMLDMAPDAVSENQNNLFIGLDSDTVTDQISGGGGADTILALGGTNVVDGGLGVDTMSFAHDTRGVDLDMFDTGEQSTGEDTHTVRNVENIVGSDRSDQISGSGRDNVLAGMDGDDTIFGGYGDDVLIGGLGDDTLDGGLGNDILISMGGGDTMTGGSGADTFIIDIQSVMNFMTHELDNLNYPMHFDGYHTIEDFNTRSDSLEVVMDLGDFDDIISSAGSSSIAFAGDATSDIASMLSYDAVDGMLSLNISSLTDGAGDKMGGTTNSIELAQLSRGMDEQDVLGSITGYDSINDTTLDLDILQVSEILDASPQI